MIKVGDIYYEKTSAVKLYYNIPIEIGRMGIIDGKPYMAESMFVTKKQLYVDGINVFGEKERLLVEFLLINHPEYVKMWHEFMKNHTQEQIADIRKKGADLTRRIFTYSAYGVDAHLP